MSNVILKFTATQITEHIQKIQKIVAEHKKLFKAECFTAVTPEELESKLRRVNSPSIISQGWGPAAPGGTVNYSVGIYNPDPTAVGGLFAHVFVGAGNVDPVTGTFLSNIDTRFPNLTLPDFAGLTLAAGASTTLSFVLKVPASVEKTNYLGNTCLMQFNWHDIGLYLDRSIFVFKVA